MSVFQPQKVQSQPWAALAGETASGTHTLAAVTLPPVAGLCNAIAGVLLSYSAAPTGGNLYVLDGTSTVVNVDVVAGGPTQIDFRGLLADTPNTPMTVGLADGGASVVGKVQPVGVFAIPLPPESSLRPDASDNGLWGPYF